MAKKKIRNRIVEYKSIPSNQIEDNPKNFRLHPDDQKEALQDILDEIGIVDTVLVREMPNGNYQLIDGHLRKDVLKGTDIPAIVVDLDDEESDLVLATHDPLAAMAKSDPSKVDALLRDINTSSQAVSDLLTSLAEASGTIPKSQDRQDGSSDPNEPLGEIKPIIQYTLIFEDDDQQNIWFDFIRYVNSQYPDLPTIGSRVAHAVGLLMKDDDESGTY